MSLFKEFKDFLLKGNLIEIAIGLILALEVSRLVDSFVNNIVMQIVGIVVGDEPTFNSLAVTINDSRIAYGAFLTSLVSFVVIGAVLFLIVKVYNRAVEMAKRGQGEEGATEVDEEVQVLREIRDLLQERPNR